MPNAANLIQAVGLALENLQLDSDGGQLQSAIATFNDAWIASFSLANVAERTVLNWIVPLRDAEANAPVTGDVGQIAAAGDVLTRMLYATYTAQNATPARITGAQATAVLTAYNTFIAVF